MVVSMRPMSAGEGYRYLLKSVAAGDGDRPLSTPLTRYYAETGTPPGRWLGSAVREVGVAEGEQVTEQQLGLLLGEGRHPLTGEQLGRAYPVYEGSSGRRAVAGFDFTFSVPKSASVLWAVSDVAMQERIIEAHHAAIRDVVAFMEREVAATRIGMTVTAGPAESADCAVAQVETTGLIATAYDHYDSRAGDPHLHTHVVVSNKVRTAGDGRWRSLDSRPLHAWTVALSELHQAVFADHLTRALGVGWDPRSRGRDRNPDWAISGVPQRLVGAFSSRATAIDEKTDELIRGYVEQHGHRPRRAVVNRLRGQACLATRPPKQIRSLAELTDRWRGRAARVLGGEDVRWTGEVLAARTPGALRVEDIPLGVIAEVAEAVVTVVGEKRSTWRRTNLYAEAARQTMRWRFETTRDREAVTGLVVDAAEQRSLRLTPPDLSATPAMFTRPDGSSRFRPKDSVIYSSEELLGAESRLLDQAETYAGPTVPAAHVKTVLSRGVGRRALSREQADAVTKVATDPRLLDLLIGPAGAGKTTTLRALKRAWTQWHGRGSVVGLAPSAAAAEVLAGELGIRCENTAKWLYDHTAATGPRQRRFAKNQLVIIDEASLAGTLTLDAITEHAAQVGAKVLLVGDAAQLQAVDAGGSFAFLTASRPDAPALTDIHRFTHDWEKTVSLKLRHGDPSAIGTYLAHGRFEAGSGEEMTEAAYAAWRADQTAGRATVLIAPTAEIVNDLNTRARAERIDSGEVTCIREVALVGGMRASVGDLVITRRNDRRLRTPRGGWVRNGDRWIITGVRRDGSVRVRHPDGSLTLPPDYVATDLNLGYAVTAHRAQGMTVDAAHVVVSATTTRESLYVAMTRGRDANHVYVGLDSGHEHDDVNPDSTARQGSADLLERGRDVLAGVLATSGAEMSATQTVKAEQNKYATIGQLATEYETIATAAQRDRWTRMLHACVPDALAAAATKSDAFGPLAAELRRAEAAGFGVPQTLESAVARGPLRDVDDVAAVLRHRIRLVEADGRAGTSNERPQRLIAGLVPEAVGDLAPEMRQALDQRRDLIEQGATALAQQAVRAGEPWTRALGPTPSDPVARSEWQRALRAVAAYRDRYGLTSPAPFGDRPTTSLQGDDRARAEMAVRRAAQAAALPRTATPTADRGIRSM